MNEEILFIPRKKRRNRKHIYGLPVSAVLVWCIICSVRAPAAIIEVYSGQSINTAALGAQPGDTVNIHAGTYRETVVPPRSGAAGSPITYQSAGDGTVIISGCDTVATAWTVDSGSIYKTTIALPVTNYQANYTNNATILANQIFVGSDDATMKMMAEARWPNLADTDDLLNMNDLRFNNGFSNGTGQTIYLSDPGMTTAASTNALAGATIWFGGWFKNRTGTITDSSAGNITCVLPAGTDNALGDASGYKSFRQWYYLVNAKVLLDTQKEWFYNGSTLYFWAPGGGVPADVKFKKRNFAFDLHGVSYITVKGLTIAASTIWTDGNSQGIIIDGINARYISHHVTLPKGWMSHGSDSGIRLNGTNSVIRNSTIRYSAGFGIVLKVAGNKAENNLVSDIDYAGTYDCGISPAAHPVIITHNTVTRTGRSSIDNFRNDIISYNDLSVYGCLNPDLGALYTCCTIDCTGAIIDHNVIHDHKSLYWATGLYTDNGSGGALIHHNIFWNTGDSSIQRNQGYWPNTVYNNTDVTGKNGYAVIGGATGADDVRNNIFAAWGGSRGSTNLYKTVNPLFVNPAANDYHLQSGSPARDAGGVITPYTDGFAGTAPDIGAYEFGAADWKAGYTPGGIAPAVNGAPASFTTNRPFLIILNVDRNFGYWSTNGTSFSQLTTSGVSISISNTTTLRTYGASNSVSGLTNTYVYTFDTAAPVITGAPPDFTTNKAFTVTLGVNEPFGYWSTNRITWNQFSTNGAGISITAAATLWYYGRDVLGNAGVTNSNTYAFDTNAPVVSGAPLNFTTNQPFSITLSVNENHGYWSTNGSAFAQFTSALPVTIAVTTNTTLRWYGRDVLGNTGATNTRTYIVGAGIPNTPGAFAAKAAANSITLRWADSSTNESAFRVYRSSNGVNFYSAGSAAANATNYTDTGLATGMPFWYQVSATNASGESSPASAVYAVTAPNIMISGGNVVLTPLRNIASFIYTIAKDCVESIDILFSISPAGMNSFQPPGGILRGMTLIQSNGTFTNDWSPSAGFDMTVKYDIRIAARVSGFTNAFILSNVDLSPLGSISDDPERVIVYNNPSRGGAPVIFANIARGARVAIYSISGRKVAQLTMDDDSGRLPWEPVIDGRRAAAGVYLCVVNCRGTTKMLRVLVR
ncbi:MAG: right-handed parallel beta-helix repeat-containing protein [Spirochaetes bacterium]|nr:right-handed parallel beta-helix repeat-containing protein [Spirochaetota bacterium]